MRPQFAWIFYAVLTCNNLIINTDACTGITCPTLVSTQDLIAFADNGATALNFSPIRTNASLDATDRVLTSYTFMTTFVRDQLALATVAETLFGASTNFGFCFDTDRSVTDLNAFYVRKDDPQIVRRTSSIAFTYYTAPDIIYPCKLYLLVASVQLTATEFVLDAVYQDGTSTAFSVSVNPFFGGSNTTCGDVLECIAVPIAYFSGTTFANLGNLYIISFALNKKILTEIRILTSGAPDLAIFGMTGVYPEPGSPETLPPVTPPTGGAPTPGPSPAGNPNPPPASAPTPGPSPAGNPNPSPNSPPIPGPSPTGSPNVPPGAPESAPDTSSPGSTSVPTSSGTVGAPQASPKAPTTAPTQVGCPATQPTGPSGYSLSCVGSQWVIVGNVVISSTTSPISTFSVPPNTATPTVVVSGCVNITSNTVAELLLDPDTANKIANKTLQQIVLIQSQASCLTGRFDSVTVKCSDGSNTASCTSSCVGTEQQSSPQSLTVLFSSSCSNLDAGLPLSLPWWGILIIVVGIIAIIFAVLVLSAIFSKKFRRAVFPFLERRKHMQNQAGDNDF